MKKTLYVLISALLLIGCGGDDELRVNSSLSFLARTDQSGENTITATFYVFKPGDYDPTTFKENGSHLGWESGEIKTKNGETVKSFFLDIVLKGDGYGIYECTPGNYYVVASISSKGSNGIIWKAKQFTVEKNKWTPVGPIFKNTYTSGFVEWEE